jgi:hypothetical protein
MSCTPTMTGMPNPGIGAPSDTRYRRADTGAFGPFGTFRSRPPGGSVT